MRCDEAEPLLLRRLERRLGAAESQRVERHLALCERCRATVETQERVAAVLSARPAVEAPVGFAHRVMANLDTSPGWLELLNWRVWTCRLAPVAAAMVVVAVLGFGSTKTTEPLEFSDLVADWVVDEDAGALPAFSLLWQEAVADETLLEAVLTANPNEPF